MSASNVIPSEGAGLAAPAAQPFQVGRWTVEPALHTLSAGDQAVKIEPKAMVVLRYLAERSGEVVSREALLQAAWSGVIVGDDALTQVVVKLRKALGDAPGQPEYIQTISKGGYRLVAPVVRLGAQRAPQQSTRPPRRRLPWYLGIGVPVVLVIAGFWWAVERREVGGAPSPVVATAVRPPAEATQPTVAVRPFEAIGNDPQEALLARGITADIVTDLSKMPGLWVLRAAPQSGMDGEGLPNGAPPIRYLVSGTVQRAGDRVRLQVHLSDARTGKQLWSERFDRALSGLFEIQEELGPKILESLPVKVGEAERRRIAQRYTRNLEAYETFQRGQLALQTRRKAENENARELFRRAIDLDATFARAYAALAMTHAADYRNQWAQDRALALERAFQLARTANQIDSDIPETYWVLAFVHSHRHEHDEALRHLQSAIRLNPSFADGYALMGGILTSLGRPEQAVSLLHTAMRLGPDSGYLHFMLLGRAYLLSGDMEQARTYLARSLSRNPEFLDAHVYLAAVHVAAGDNAAAAWEADEIRTLQPGFTARRWFETNPTADGPLKTKVTVLLGTLGF